MIINRYEIKKEEDIYNLKEIWNNLEKGKEMTTFQTFEWNRLLLKEWEGWKMHRIYSRCFIYIAYEKDVPVMLLPIIVYKFSTKTKWFGSKKGIYILGHGSYSDYLNAVFVTFNGNVFDEICAALFKDFPGFRFILSSIREDSQLAAFLKKRNTYFEKSTVAVSVKKKNSLEEYEASLSKKTRTNLRKAMNRINRDNIDYQLEILGAVKDKALLNEMVNIHVKRILIKNTKDSGVLHILSSYVRKAYRKYRDLHNNIIAMCMNENENSVVVLIRMNGKLAGYQYGVREEHAIRLLQTCFDEEFKFYSPVFRGVYDYIRKSYEDDSLLEIDFTRGDEEFKYRLGGEEIALYDFII